MVSSKTPRTVGDDGIVVDVMEIVHPDICLYQESAKRLPSNKR